MRAQTIAALREYWPDADDATGLTLLIAGGDPPSEDAWRLVRLLLRALREHEQEIRDLRQRLAAAGIP